MRFISRIKSIYENCILYLLVGAVVLMLFLTLLNIILRFFESTILWVEPVVRHLVFIAAFLGGSVASSKNEHIKIDIISKIIKKDFTKKLYQIFIQLFTIIILYYLFQSGVNFYEVEKEYASSVFLGFKSSTLVALIPFGFSLIIIQSIFNLISLIFLKEGSNNE